MRLKSIMKHETLGKSCYQVIFDFDYWGNNDNITIICTASIKDPKNWIF